MSNQAIWYGSLILGLKWVLKMFSFSFSAKKTEAEGPENAAKEAHKNAWDGQYLTFTK